MEQGERVALQAITREAMQECFSRYVSARNGDLGGEPTTVLSDDICDALAESATQFLLMRVAAISSDPVAAREVVIGELFRTFLLMQNVASETQKQLMDEHTN